MCKLNDKIKTLRKEKNISQEDLAKALGLSRSTIAGYETNKRKPDINTIHKIADFFNISVDYLLGRSIQRVANDKINLVLSSDPELSDFLDKFLKSRDLQKIFKLIKDLNPTTIKQIIGIIKVFKNGEQEK